MGVPKLGSSLPHGTNKDKEKQTDGQQDPEEGWVYPKEKKHGRWIRMNRDWEANTPRLSQGSPPPQEEMESTNPSAEI